MKGIETKDSPFHILLPPTFASMIYPPDVKRKKHNYATACRVFIFSTPSPTIIFEHPFAFPLPEKIFLAGEYKRKV